MKVTLLDYHRECKKIFADLGFVRSGKTYGRVINDIFQTFTEDRIHSGRLWRVDFGVFPLCMDGSKAVSYNSDYFVDDYASASVSFSKDERSYQSFIRLLSFLKYILLPLFQKATSCASALEILEEYDKKENDRRLDSIKADGGVDHARPLREYSIFKREKYYIALKNENYPYAVEHLDCRIKIFGESLMREKERFQDKSRIPSDNESSGQYIAWAEKLISDLKNDRDRIVNGDYEYFKSIIQQNEDKSRNELAKFIR